VPHGFGNRWMRRKGGMVQERIHRRSFSVAFAEEGRKQGGIRFESVGCHGA